MADDEHVLGNPLSIEDEEYEVVHGPDLVPVVTVTSVEEAGAQARLLVAQGVGAAVAEVTDPAGYEVRVLPEDAGRAAELLGLAAPPAADPHAGAAETGDPAAADKQPVPWKPLLVLWVAAMIVLPLLAFFGSYLLSR